ncbi:hypothetical protein V7187_22025, partial [Gottfriedia acidiceleris]
MTKQLEPYQYLKKRVDNSFGFTFVEMLLVLSIMILLLILPINQVRKIEDEQKLTLFIQMI